MLAYVPDRLSDADLSAELLKRGSAGAAWADKFNELGGMHSAIHWECAVDHNPPACIKPIKPKYWLTSSCKLEPNMIYRVQ